MTEEKPTTSPQQYCSVTRYPTHVFQVPHLSEHNTSLFTGWIAAPRAQQGGLQQALSFGLAPTPFDVSRSGVKSVL